jgi:o-succinylbenzoate---CoA ligase
MNELVALDLANSTEFIEAIQRVWDSGDAALPLDQRLPAPAKAALLEQLRPSTICDATGRHRLADPMPIEPGDAVVVATSGSTGIPKGVILTHDAIQASATITNRRLSVDTNTDRWYACLPFAHIGGLSVVLRSILGRVPITPTSIVDGSSIDRAAQNGHTLISLVPAALARINPSAWRHILLGGSAMPDHLPSNAIRTYGMTETGSGIVYNGWALDEVDIRVSDGEIELRSPTLARGYRVASGIRPLATSADGWFQTGDAGSLDMSGELRVSGRIGDVIVSGGEKVWPEPVERCLQTFPGIADAAVCGIADPRWGHAVVAVVVVTAGTTLVLDRLRDHVKQTLPAYCAPQQLVVVDRLPRTSLGKIQRSVLAAETATAITSRESHQSHQPNRR